MVFVIVVNRLPVARCSVRHTDVHGHHSMHLCYCRFLFCTN